MLEKYTKKKGKNQIMKSLIDGHVSILTHKRICECGDWIEFKANHELDKLKVNRANFCKNRFCPMCAWRQTRRDALKIGVMMEYIGVEHKKAFIFVTLTAPNVKGDMLSDEITRYNKAFGKLIKRDVVTDMNHGYIRKLEITYNRKRDDYHTHLHCVFAVDESYFTSRKYLSQSRWLELWRDVMSDENITQVDVRRVKKSESGKEVSELAKYAAKDSDYTHNQVVFDVFYKALKGRQVLTYNGIFTMANKKYKDGELDKYIELDNTEYCFMLLYLWGNGEYIEKKRRELSEEEQCVLNVRLEEMEVE